MVLMLQEISEIVIAKKQTMDTDSSATAVQPKESMERLPAPPEYIYLDWTELQLKTLKRSLRKLKNDWVHVQSVFYQHKTVDEMKKALAVYRKKKLVHLFSANQKVRGFFLNVILCSLLSTNRGKLIKGSIWMKNIVDSCMLIWWAPLSLAVFVF